MTTGLDVAYLREHTSIASDGIHERLFTMEIDGDHCYALLTLPDTPRDPGFVVCHSWGLELLTLRRTERAVARVLAGLGHPVLAFHRRGFGDSTGRAADATLDRQLEDLRTAANRLSIEAGTSGLGLIGGRFGGIVAGAAAREGGIDRLILMNTPLKGASYFRGIIREMHMVQVTNRDASPRRSMEDIVGDLERDGVIDVLGYPVYWPLYQELADVDLSADMGAFEGQALVLQISKGATPPKELEAFRATIESTGGTCRIEALKEPPGARFGGAAFVRVDDPNVRVDVQQPMVEEIVQITKEWMSQ